MRYSRSARLRRLLPWRHGKLAERHLDPGSGTPPLLDEGTVPLHQQAGDRENKRCGTEEYVEHHDAVERRRVPVSTEAPEVQRVHEENRLCGGIRFRKPEVSQDTCVRGLHIDVVEPDPVPVTLAFLGPHDDGIA